MLPLFIMVSEDLEKIFLFRSDYSKKFMVYCYRKVVAKNVILVSFEEARTGLEEVALVMPLSSPLLLNIFRNVWESWNCFCMISRKKLRC